MLRVLFLCALLIIPAALRADPGTMCSKGAFGPRECIRPAHFVHDVCQTIDSFSRQHGLDPGFFARLLWQESRFDPNALSPANARGIAQFIDSTAALRGLEDSYNPAEAMEFSAQYLGELSRRYGNHGLAAVAYNGGERRADGLVGGTGGLARETVNYVRIITGLPAEVWRDEPPETHDYSLQPDKPFQAACHELARNRALTKFKTPANAYTSPFGVQMAFGTTRSRAEAKFNDRTRTCRVPLDGRTAEYIWQKSRASPAGGYFMARVGAQSLQDGWALCNKLKKSGCLCAVYRNP